MKYREILGQNIFLFFYKYPTTHQLSPAQVFPTAKTFTHTHTHTHTHHLNIEAQSSYIHCLTKMFDVKIRLISIKTLEKALQN